MSKFLRIGLVAEPLYRSPPHQHTFWEICLYTSGRGTAFVGGQEVPFKSGTIICYPPNIPHHEETVNGTTEYYMHADVIPTDGRLVPSFSDGLGEPFRRVCALLHEEYLLRPPNWVLTTQDLFNVLLLYLERWGNRPEVHPLVLKLQRELVAHIPNAKFRIGEALAAYPMADDHLRHLFTQATGRPPLDYLNRLRVDTARHLIAMGGFRIKEVAERVGIADPYYFSRLFKKIDGRSPAAYRRAAAAARGRKEK